MQATAWEFYLTETLHDRLKLLMQAGQRNVDVSGSFIKIKNFIKYNNGCFSVMNFYKHGSLLVIYWFEKNASIKSN